MGYTETYKKAAQHTDQDKARVIKRICELLWEDDYFYKAIYKYAKSARTDLN